MYWRIIFQFFCLMFIITKGVSRKIHGDCRNLDTCAHICTDIGENEVKCSCHKQHRLAEDGRSCVYIYPDGSTWRPPRRLIAKKFNVNNKLILRKTTFSIKDDEDDASGSGLYAPNCDDEDGCDENVFGTEINHTLSILSIKASSSSVNPASKWLSSNRLKSYHPESSFSPLVVQKSSKTDQFNKTSTQTVGITKIDALQPVLIRTKSRVTGTVISSLVNAIVSARNNKSGRVSTSSFIEITATKVASIRTSDVVPLNQLSTTTSRGNIFNSTKGIRQGGTSNVIVHISATPSSSKTVKTNVIQKETSSLSSSIYPNLTSLSNKKTPLLSMDDYITTISMRAPHTNRAGQIPFSTEPLRKENRTAVSVVSLLPDVSTVLRTDNSSFLITLPLLPVTSSQKSKLTFGTTSTSVLSSVKKETITHSFIHKPKYNCTTLGCHPGEKCSYGYCQCPFGKNGSTCLPDPHIQTPSFNETSYMTFRKQNGLYRRFQISIEFLSEASNGVLMHSSDFEAGGKDYFAVGIENNAVVFKFDCGSGTGIVKGDHPIKQGVWHRIFIRRQGNIASVQLDTGMPIHNRIGGKHKHLTLGNLYVGGFKTNYTYARTGFSSGFKGCIRKIIINNKELSLRSADTKAIVGSDIGNCSHVWCQASTCPVGSTCYITKQNTATCLCSVGRSGKHCSKSTAIKIPSFKDPSFMGFKIENYRQGHSLDIEMIIKPKESNASGILLYNGDDINGEGDYFALFLNNGSVIFQLDCGSGHAVLRSQTNLRPGMWNKIVISKRGRSSSLEVNGFNRTYGTTPGYYNRLNMRRLLYVGGVEDFSYVSENINIHSGFSGCIQKISINHHELMWKNAKNGLNVENCETHPCVSKPCGDHGICEPRHSSFVCHCLFGYKGNLCQEEFTIDIPSFEKHSFLALREEHILYRLRERFTSLSFSFKSRSKNGSIFCVGQEGKRSSRDYQALYLENGYLVCRYNLGGGEVKLVSKMLLNDGLWHKVILKRNDGVSQLIVDGKFQRLGRRQGIYRILNVYGKIYFGFAAGFPHKGQYTSKEGFRGCLKDVNVDESKVFLLQYTKLGHNIKKCDAD